MNYSRFGHPVLLAGLLAIPFTPLVVSSSLFFPYITGKAFVFRIIVEVLLGLWCVQLLVDPAARPRRSGLLWAVAGLIGVTALATIFGVDPFRSLWSNFERMDGLITYLHLGAYFLLLTVALRTEKLWRWWLGTSLGVSVVMVIYALVEYSRLAPGVSSRLAATLGNPIYLAVYLLLHLFIAALFWSWATERWQKILLTAIILAELWALYQTGTRSAILGLGVGILLAAVLTVWKARTGSPWRRVAVGGLALAVILGGSFWLARESEFIQSRSLLARFANISLEDATTRHRLLNWQMALQGFKERPLLGWGPENYIQVFAKYFDPALYDAEPWFDRTHNIFLDWLVSAGLLGLLTYLALYAVALYYLWRRGNSFTLAEQIIFTSLLAAYLVHNLFVFDNLASYLLFFGCLAYLHQRAGGEAGSRVVRSPENLWFNRVVKLGAGVGVALAVFSLYSVNFLPWRTNRTLIQALSSTEPERRLTLLEQAVDYGTLGRVEASEQLITEGLRIVRQSEIPQTFKERAAIAVIDRLADQVVAPAGDVRLALFYGSFLRLIGGAGEAVTSLERARDLAPRKQSILFELAQAYLAVGRKDEALSVAEVTYHLAPDFDEARRFYAFLLSEAGRQDEAEAILRERETSQLVGSTTRLITNQEINTYAAAGNFAKVLSLWQERVRQSPGNFQYRVSLAAAYLKVGEREQAIAQLEEALTLDPTRQAVIQSLISDIRAGRNPSAQ